MFTTISLLCRWVSILLVAVLASSPLIGCSPNQFKTEAAQVPQLISAALGEPTTFNYPLNDSAYSVFGFLYDGLLTENGLTGKLEPAVAESWQLSENKQRVVFTLRKGLKWSDGQPFTTDDIVFTYNNIYLNEKIPTGIRDILRIGTSGSFPTVKKLDQRRVEFTIPEPFAPFLRNTGGLPILPAHILRESVQSTGPDGNPKFLSTWGTDTDPQKIIGNGPYRMESFTPTQRVIFRRNPYYWRKDAQGNPQPYIERIVLQIIESTDNQLLSFRNGDLDNLEVAPEAFELLKQEEKRRHFNIYNGGIETGTTFVAFNLNKARNSRNQPLVNPIKSRWFNTVAFRQAVAHAIDRETIKNNVYRGLGELQNSPIYIKSPYYLSPQEGLKVYDYNPDKAKQLLLGAGFKYNDNNQLLDAEGNRVRFTLLTNVEQKTRVDMAAQIKRDLSKIGIQVDLQILSFNPYIERVSVARSYDCYLGGFLGGGIEPNSGFNIWNAEGALHTFNQGPIPGEPPLIGWEAADWERKISDLYIQGAQELDEAKRKTIYAQTQQIAQEQLPFIHLVERISLDAVSDRVQGIKYTALGGAFWNLYELKVAQK